MRDDLARPKRRTLPARRAPALSERLSDDDETGVIGAVFDLEALLPLDLDRLAIPAVLEGLDDLPPLARADSQT